MPQLNYPNMGNNQQMQNIQQYPYGNNNYSINQPYDYMGRQMQQNLPIQYLKCRPVASKEEARACQIDLDGSLWVFTDVANGKIYTKQINNDGTAAFKTYIFTEDQSPYNSNEYVTKAEFDKVIQTLMASMNNGNNNSNAGNNNTENGKNFAF